MPDWDQAEGRLKQEAGRLTGDEDLQYEGGEKRTVGDVKDAAGDAKDKAGDTWEDVKDKADDAFDRDK